LASAEQIGRRVMLFEPLILPCKNKEVIILSKAVEATFFSAHENCYGFSRQKKFSKWFLKIIL